MKISPKFLRCNNLNIQISQGGFLGINNSQQNIFVKLYLMDSYPKSKVGELEVALKTGFAAVVFVCFIEPSKPMRVVWIVHFLLVASVSGSVLAHCRKK